MAKKNPAVLWSVDQTGDVIGAEGRTTVQGNVGLGDDFVKSSESSKKYVTHVSRNSDGTLKVNVLQPSLSDLNATTANRSIGTNSSGAIEAQDLSNVTSSAETNPATGTTYVSSITQSTNGQVSYKTQTITEATDEANSAKKGITTLTSDLYASNTRTTGHTTAVTPDGVWDAIDSLDVNDITGFGADQTLSTLTETDGKITATFQPISIGGSAITLGAASQAVVTDASKNLTTKDLTVESSTDETATNKFVSTVTADSTGKITVKKANVAIDGTATTLSNASQAVVTDGSNHLTTEDLSVSSSTDGSDTNKFVSSVTANAKGKITVTKGTLSVATDNAIGGIKTGFTDDNANRKYAVDVVDSGTGKDTAFVQVPLASVYNTTTPANTYAGLVKSVSPQSTDPLSIRYHGVEIKNDGTMRVFVPYWHTNIASDSLEIPEIGGNVNTYEETIYVELFLKENGGLQWGYGPHEDYGYCRELSVNNIVELTHGQAGDHEEVIPKLVIDSDFKVLSNGTTDIGVFAPMPQSGDTGKIVAVNGDTLEFINYTGGGVKNIRFSVDTPTAQDDVYNEIQSCYDSSQYKWTMLPLLSDEYGRHWQLCGQGQTSYAFMTRGNGTSYLMNFSHYSHMPTITTFNDCIVYDIESNDDTAHEDLCKEIWNKASLYGLLVSIKDKTTQCYAFASMVGGIESSPTVQFTGIDGTQVRVFTIGNGTSWKWVTSAYTYLTPFRLNIVDNANPKHSGYNCEINGSSNAYEASLPAIIKANEFIGPLTGTATKATNADITRTASLKDGDLWQIGNGTSQRLVNAKYAYYDHNDQLLTKRQLPWKFTTNWAAYRSINSAVSCPADTYTILELDPSTVKNFPISGAWLQLAAAGKPVTAGGWRECEVVYDAIFKITNPTSDYLFAVIELLTFGTNIPQATYCARSARRLYLVPGSFAYSVHCSFHLFIDDNGNVDPDIASEALINGAQCRLGIRPNSTAITINYANIWAGVMGRAYDID